MTVETIVPVADCAQADSSHSERLVREAETASCTHTVPDSPGAWHQRVRHLREALNERLHLVRLGPSPDLDVHGEIRLDGYRILRVSFLSAPDIRVTGNLYIPEGAGPFPAVLNMHGHWRQGKLAPAVQARGHILAKNGMVVLTVDAAGAGERGGTEGLWEYHGAAKAGELFLAGDSLLGFQVRDNMRALDVLESLPFVDSSRIGATGASGGGNQTIWLAALDERVQVAVPVACTGSFAAYVTRRNCMCETLPDGLALAEQWELLGAIAPRPLLVLNALHDQPAFGCEALEFTCGMAGQVYHLLGATKAFDWRVLDMAHGFKPPALEAMLGWMTHWLGGEPSPAPARLPSWNPLPEDKLLCFPKGQRPESCSYTANRQTLARNVRPLEDAGQRAALARLIGWREPLAARMTLSGEEDLPGDEWTTTVQSPRGILQPVRGLGNPGEVVREIHLLLSPEGCESRFVNTHWSKGSSDGVLTLAVDLPAVGELAWEEGPVGECRLHDASRACLWLGYTLAAEWAECIAAFSQSLRQQFRGANIQILAEREMAFCALLALALQPTDHVVLREYDSPKSLLDGGWDSLVWSVPGLLRWGDLGALRTLVLNQP